MTSKVPAGIIRGRLSDEEEANIIRLGARLGAGQIALRINRHPSTISYAMHRHGLRTLTKRDFCYMRAGILVKSFSKEEDEYLTELRVQGLGVEQIAALVTAKFGHKRTRHTISVRLVLLSNAEAE